MSLTGGLWIKTATHPDKMMQNNVPGSHEMVSGPEPSCSKGNTDSPCLVHGKLWKTIRDQTNYKPLIRNLWHRQPSPPKWSLLFNSWDSYLEPDKGWNSEWTRPSKTEMSDPVVRHGDNGHEEHARGLEMIGAHENFQILFLIQFNILIPSKLF